MTVINIEQAKLEVNKNGFLDVAIDPSVNLFDAIEKLKEKKNAVLLAHYYQDADIQDVADFIGDSLGLAQEAERTKAEIIVFAGVHFMAETAKILNPNKKVLLPDLNAGCSLADSAPTEAFRTFRESHPDHLVISYINCTAEIKALSDIICTSSNAEKIIESLPVEQKIIFAPDKNLGAYLKKKTGRDMLLWNGACIVHEIFSVKKITELRTRHPSAKFIAHPECEEPVLRMADFIGSTTALLNYTKSSTAKEFIVGTESGILHQMKISSPEKIFIPAPPETNCACNDCPYMKLNTIEKLYLCMEYETPEIHMSADLLEKSRKPIERMLEISRRYNL